MNLSKTNLFWIFLSSKFHFSKMYSRKVNDPISPHSERLVSYMNTHPATILGYAKYYGETRSAVSARMVDIDSNGFVVEVEEENGSKSEVHIKFKIRLRSYEEVRPTLTRMAQEAEDALGLVKYICIIFINCYLY